MRRFSTGLALICAIAAAGCGGAGKSATAASGAAKGVFGQYFYLAVAPAVGGTIASGDGLIACQPNGTGCGDATYHQTKYNWATPVVLTAAPLAGFQFVSWAGDCSGTSNVCTLSGTNAGTDYTAVAVFKNLNAPTAPTGTTMGRVYGYVKDGGVGVAGVTVSLGSQTAKTSASGAYVFEIAPGSYTLATVASTQYAAAAPVAVTVPVPDGVADPAGACFLGGAKQGYWVPTAGQAAAGCLVKQSDIAVTRAGTYVAPAVAPAIVTTPAMPAIVGFGAPVTVGCGAGGVVTQVSGPTTAALTGPDASGNYAFTTPDLGTALASPSLATLAVVKDGRPSFLSINQAQAGALTYSFKCAQGAASATVSIPLVTAVNANIATALRGEPFVMASYLGATTTLPGVTGPLWAAGAETITANPDGSTWRAHDAVQVPPGVILILDGPANANWKFCSGSKDSYTGTCGVSADTTTANAAIVGNGTGNAWVKASWTVSKSLYLTSDALSATVSGFVGEPNIPVKPQIWGGWDLTSTPGGSDTVTTLATVESCGLCHVSPGARLAGGTYELGPTEPVIGWKESKHARAAIDGGSSTHFTLQACGACHTAGYDPNLPGNKGFSDVLGSYTNDFLFEGSDATIWMADLAAKNPAAALLNNVQCGNCHGPTPSATNHTASLSAKVCGTCHNGYNDQYGQWAGSMHALLAPAQGHGVNRDATHCARCHTAQGFFVYLNALKGNNPDKLGNAPPAGSPAGAVTAPLLCGSAATKATDACPNTQLTGLLTAQNVDQITCQTCHDPHSLEMRLKDSDTVNGMLLAGGFKITGGGSGAICTVCHNSRNGIIGALAPSLNSSTASVGGVVLHHNDATPLQSDTRTAPVYPALPFQVQGTGGPHVPAQGDVYYAGNGYLLGQPMPTQPNYHADPNFFQDTCAECHVKRLSTATAGKSSNHTFAVDAGTCAGCHGTGTELTMRKNLVINQLAAFNGSLTSVLQNAGIALVTGKLNGATTAAAYTVAPGTIVSVAPNGSNLDFTFSNGDKVTGCSADTIYNDAAKTIPTLYTLSGTTRTYGNVVKALYDVQLINNDKSSGVHNIPFVDAMLNAIVNHLDTGTIPK